LILVISACNITIGFAGTRFWSDQIDLPIPYINNNVFRVWNALNSPMNTPQATYDFEFNPGGKYRLGVRSIVSNSIVTNDSFFFIVQYF
jgi:hypothetical protein